MGINRQQFTKYLNGAARPSARNMRRICDHFGVEEEELLIPHGRACGPIADTITITTIPPVAPA